MVFECQQCGECCQHMGQVHVIIESRSNSEFLMRNTYTGEKDVVEIDSDKQHLFKATGFHEEFPEACPFLRYSPRDGKAYCTVHRTRPGICRDYGCWRLLILNSQGERAGRVMYQRTFVSDDPLLGRTWRDCIDPLDEPDDDAWDRKISMILTPAGYTVKR